jgi:hypothetical protein
MFVVLRFCYSSTRRLWPNGSLPSVQTELNADVSGVVRQFDLDVFFFSS